jgi:hypothetical protein
MASIDLPATRSHRGGHWFDPSIAHPVQRPVVIFQPAVFDLAAAATTDEQSGYIPPLLSHRLRGPAQKHLHNDARAEVLCERPSVDRAQLPGAKNRR